MPQSRARTAICSAPLEWPSRPGLPTRNFRRRPSGSETRLHRRADLLEARRASSAAASATPGGGAVFAEYLAQNPAPFAGGHAGLRAGDGGRHDVAAVLRRGLRGRQGRRPPALASRASRHSWRAAIWPCLHVLVHHEDAALVGGEGRGFACRVYLLTPTTRFRRLRWRGGGRSWSPPAEPSCSRWPARRRPSRRCGRVRRGRDPSVRPPWPATAGLPSKRSSYSSRSVS